MANKTEAKCPCCKARVGIKQIRKITSLFPFDGMMVDPRLGREESFMQILARYPNMYQWACDGCIEEEKAILGQPASQFYTFKYPWDTASPYFAYFDQTFQCQQCREQFVFSKEEQQYWYENLQFVVYSKPLHCPDCRKEIRKARNINKELSDLLKEGVPDDIDQLLRIAEIYAQLGKEEKEKAYLKAARRLKAKE